MSTISPIPAVERYSANVQLTLFVDSVSFRLAQIGPDFFILAEDVVLPGTSGIVSIQVDETDDREAATWEASENPRRFVKASYSPLA